MASVMNAPAMAAVVVGAAGVAADGKFSQRRTAFFPGGGFCDKVWVNSSRRGGAGGVLRVVAENLGAANSTMEGGKAAVVSNAEVERMAPREEQSDGFSGSSGVEVSRERVPSALQWRCVEANVENDRLHYGRFAVSPFRVGQANTVGIAMRRALLGEVEGAAVTCATFKDVAHEYSVMEGIQESVLDILLNLKELVVRSDSQERQKAFISTIGPGEVTAGDIILPPSLEITDPSQHICLLTKAIPFDLELEVERDCGYRIADPSKSTEGRFYLDSVFMPVRNANYSVHSFENEDITQEILFLEIWTNGSITPEEALYEAARSLIDLFLPFLQAEKREVANTSIKEHGSSTMSYFSSFLPSAEQISKEVTYKHIFIDQLKLPARAYNCLKRANIHTVSDLMDFTQDDLMRIKNFGKKSVEEVLEALRVQFNINLPKTKA
ncbi:hypothetical protein M758_7G050200 [Ceratodon purpureus]|uniref:DNA-directed RNA polymerase n=1 Tax=Ceratodon purpureus TaxID=3225 RepID=A0A8T0H7V2_CERPU|nr:hypothetical protein KC19_7G053200 [Ceratodon purpureus]KAG0610247.1 hypothetical protein M758_7G050200 [Ceratodon purpureus]